MTAIQEIAPGRTSAQIAVHNPATQETIGSVPGFTAKEITAAVEKARAAQIGWARKPVQKRLSIVRRFQQLLAEQKETVAAVMRHLGNESWEERQHVRQKEGHSDLAWLIPVLLAGLGISAVVLVVIHRRRKRRLRLQEMAAVPESIAQNLRVAHQNASRIQQLLDEFKKQMPEQDLTRFTSELAEQPDRMAKIKAEFANLNIADITFYAEVQAVKDRAEAEANLLSNTRRKLDDVCQAKAQSQLKMQKFAEENFQISDVRDGSKREEVENLLSDSRLLYNQAYQNSSMPLLDWIMINDLLDNSQRQVQRAVQVSQIEPYIPPSVYDSNSTSTFDASSPGSGSDFGGGGGFSGGSGSDGSY